MSEGDRACWDERHARRASPSPQDVQEPPALLAPWADLFPRAGPALDIACGQGRGAVWLALRGMDVWGMDVSPVAVARARDLASRCGVAQRCRFEVVDLDGGLPPGPAVDVVSCLRFRDPRLDAAVAGRLAPGGLLAVAALAGAGGSADPWRSSPAALRHAFGALDVITAEERDGVALLLARA